MIAVDTNVLVYAHRREAKEHSAASGQIAALAAGNEPWAIPWPCVYEFYSVVTNRRIWKDAASTQKLAPLLARPRVCGPVVHDARVAALCLAHGIDTLLTRDRDFSFFPELITQNPFAE